MQKLLPLAALLIAALIVGGCGSSPPRAPAPPATTLPSTIPQSSRTPEGPDNPSAAKPAAAPVSLPRVTLGEKHISVRGLHLIEGFEGFGSCPYWDPYGRVWTRGYGETEGISGNSPCISRAQGENNLRYLVEARYEWALRQLGVPLNQNQWDALCSFVWNLGAGIFQGTTVGADLRARQFYAASRIMLAYDHAGGQVLEGLRIRREAEVALFLTPEPKPVCNAACQLRPLYVRRAELRGALTKYRCRVIHGPRADPRCPRWAREGQIVNRRIHELLGGR